MEKREAPRLTPAEGRRFGLTLGLAFGAIAGVLWWRDRPGVAAILAIVAAMLITAAFVVPARLTRVHRVWMGLAMILSRVTTPIILGVLYFGVITPTGLFVRAFGTNPLARRPDGESFWIPRSPGAARRSNLRRQF